MASASAGSTFRGFFLLLLLLAATSPVKGQEDLFSYEEDDLVHRELPGSGTPAPTLSPSDTTIINAISASENNVTSSVSSSQATIQASISASTDHLDQ